MYMLVLCLVIKGILISNGFFSVRLFSSTFVPFMSFDFHILGRLSLKYFSSFSFLYFLLSRCFAVHFYFVIWIYADKYISKVNYYNENGFHCQLKHHVWFIHEFHFCPFNNYVHVFISLESIFPNWALFFRLWHLANVDNNAIIYACSS